MAISVSATFRHDTPGACRNTPPDDEAADPEVNQGGRVKTTSVLPKILATASAGFMLAAGPAQSASISYFLDQSNTLPGGTNYLQVTVTDGIDGAIDFTVEVLDALSGSAGRNFGIQSFALNAVPGGFADSSISNLPDGWQVSNSPRMDGFGFFDIKLQGNGGSRVETLTFSITGIDGDTPEDYAGLSTGTASQGQSLFAAHVAGIQIPDCNGRECASSAFFGGSTAVPLPATAWLLGVAIAGALTRARRRS